MVQRDGASKTVENNYSVFSLI